MRLSLVLKRQGCPEYWFSELLAERVAEGEEVRRKNRRVAGRADAEPLERVWQGTHASKRKSCTTSRLAAQHRVLAAQTTVNQAPKHANCIHC
jgi:hypothetical protein